MTTLLAVDLGTTSIKGAVLDLDALTIAHVYRTPFPDPLGGLPELFVEIDVLQVAEQTRRVIAALLPHARDCTGIIACGQMGGLVLCDARGNPLSNYISWRDQRLLMPHPSGSGTTWERFVEHIEDADRRALGNEVRPGLPVSFLFWLAAHERLPAVPLIAASLPDFILAHLCATCPATDITNAVGGVNLESGKWHRDLFARLGFAHVAWSVLRDLPEPAGMLEVDGRRLPWYPPAGDHQTALAGAFLAPGELSINISTGSQVSLLTSQFDHGDHQIRPFFDGLFLNTITHMPAGRALNVLVALLTELADAQGVELADPWDYIARASALAPDNELAVDLAFFPSPVGERGAISHIREGNLTVGTLFRAAFRAMSDNYQRCAARLAPTRSWRRIVFSGGLAHNLPHLRALIADRLQSAYRLCATSEDTLPGLLALGMAATGREASVQLAMQRLAALPSPVTDASPS